MLNSYSELRTKNQDVRRALLKTRNNIRRSSYYLLLLPNNIPNQIVTGSGFDSSGRMCHALMCGITTCMFNDNNI